MSEQGINLFSTQIGPKVMCLVPLTEGTVSSFLSFGLYVKHMHY